jgi:hypothetical protein
VDNPVLIIEMPNLSDEAVVALQDFLFEVINTFESQYSSQIKRYYQQLYGE